jgi:CheY-like chemotaxis protein
MGARTCKLLLVDDSDDDRALFQLAFKRAETGMELLSPLAAADDAIAYLLAASTAQPSSSSSARDADPLTINTDAAPYPQVLVLDLKMPGKSGFDVLQWLNTQPQRPLIIIFSGSDHQDDIQRALSLGADFYQIKPPGLTDWVGTIQQLDAFCQKQLNCGPTS